MPISKRKLTRKVLFPCTYQLEQKWPYLRAGPISSDPRTIHAAFNTITKRPTTTQIAEAAESSGTYTAHRKSTGKSSAKRILNVFCSYVPTRSRTKEPTQVTFWNRLGKQLKSVPKGEAKILLMDANAMLTNYAREPTDPPAPPKQMVTGKWAYAEGYLKPWRKGARQHLPD